MDSIQPTPPSKPGGLLRSAAHSRLELRAILGANALNVVVIATCCRTWHMVIAYLGVMALLVPLNLWAVHVAPRRFGRENAELIRAAANLAGVLCKAHIVGWNLPMLLWMPFFAVLANADELRWARPCLAVTLVTMSLAALRGGVVPEIVAAYLVLAITVYAMTESRTETVRGTLDALAAEHDKLVHAHEALGQLQDRAFEQEKLASLGMLAAGIAHEINNPMSYVTCNIQSLLGDLDELARDRRLRDEYAHEVLPETLDGLQRVNAIVSDLRRFARGDAQAPEEYDLNEEIRAAGRIAGNRFRNGATLELALGELPRLVGFPRQMSQVIVNLVVNAAQALKGSGKVTVRSGIEGREVWFSVSDDGIGMDAATQAKLFQPFFTTKPAGEGTGLGLAMVQGIVAAQSGSINVASAPGEGTTFTIRLPRVARFRPRLVTPPVGMRIAS